MVARLRRAWCRLTGHRPRRTIRVFDRVDLTGATVTRGGLAVEARVQASHIECARCRATRTG